MISLKMIDKGLDNGIIKIKEVKEMGLDDNIPICQIGEYWFYFALDGQSMVNHLLNLTRNEVIFEIYNALMDFNEDDGELRDEYDYYEYYLRERGINDD